MARSTRDAQFGAQAHNPANRGYCVVYRENEVNHCPGCGRTHWHVGRVTAECGFCSTAVPLAAAATHGIGGPSRAHPPVLAIA